MASQKAVVGTAYLRIDGVQQALQGSWKVQPNQWQRKPREGQSGPLGPVQKAVTPYIKGDLDHQGDFSIQALQSITNSTITLELVNGATYTLSGAWWGDDAESDTETGKVSVSFYGSACIEVVSS